MYFEGWKLIASCYFSFITLGTIGNTNIFILYMQSRVFFLRRNFFLKGFGGKY